jgi:hypothetical protein
MMQKRNFYSSSGKIKCSSCGNYHYQWWMISHKSKLSEKIGCASYMQYDSQTQAYQIISSYGSGYDNLSFEVIGVIEVPGRHLNAIERLILLTQHSVSPVICDKCIARFINKKQINQIER